MEIIFFLTLILYIFLIGSFVDFVDYDFFARLIVGKTFFQTGEILKYDFLSYSKTHPWYDHEWGASIFFYFIQDKFGDLGLYIFKTLTLFIALFFLILIIKLRRKYTREEKEFPIFNFLFFFIMLQPIFNLVLSLRCHHFTFMFFGIWLYILEKARLEKNYRVLWVLPPLMVIWSNIHGGCFMGLGITGLYILGEFLRKKPVLPYILTFASSFVFMFINPYGFEYVKFLIMATTMQRPNIVEWQSPFGEFYFSKLIKYKIFLAGFIVLALIRFVKTYKSISKNAFDRLKEIWGKTDKTKFLIIFVMCVLTIKSMRFITYFVFVLIPFCYDDFYMIFSKKLKPSHNKIKELVIFFIVLIALVLNLSLRKIRYGNFHSIFPIAEVEYLIENNVSGNIFAPFETGSYVAYKLFPNNFILQDGRYEEVYPASLNDDYVKTVTTGDAGWREKFNSIRHDIVICYKQYFLYELLKNHPDYYHISESKIFALFIRKDVYKKIKKPVRVPVNDEEFYVKTLWNTGIDWKKH